jgi:hypothetical protein
LITGVVVEKLAFGCDCDPEVISCGEVVGFRSLSFSPSFLGRSRSRLERFHSQKLGQPFEVLGRGREKELLAHEFQSPQSQASKPDLVLELRKQCLDSPTLTLCRGEGRDSRPFSRSLPHRFVHVDRNLSIAPGGALRFLCTVATALSGCDIYMRSIDRIDPHVGQLLSFGTLITVRFGKKSKLLDPVQVARGGGALFHTDIGSDATFLEPRQKLPISVGRIGGNRLGKSPPFLR